MTGAFLTFGDAVAIDTGRHTLDSSDIHSIFEREQCKALTAEAPPCPAGLVLVGLKKRVWIVQSASQFWRSSSRETLLKFAGKKSKHF